MTPAINGECFRQRHLLSFLTTFLIHGIARTSKCNDENSRTIFFVTDHSPHYNIFYLRSCISTYDKERANCDAKERDAYWYAKYWESQSQQESQEDAVRLPLVSAQNHERVESFTKRDIVLQTLLSRSEGTSSSTSSEQQTKSLISKYYFSKDKGTDDFDPKSPKKKNPPEKNHTKTNCNLASASKKAKNDLEKEDRKPPAQTKPSHHSSKLKNDMDAEKLLPTERKQSAKNEAAVKSGTINIGLSKYTPIPRKSKSNEDTSEQRQKSRLLDKMSSPSSNNPEERKENSRRSLPHDSGTSNGTKGKKRKSYPIFKSSDNVKVEVESKPLSSTNKPAAKKTKETESIVDLTFDSDSD